jgi:hypothetical protein
LEELEEEIEGAQIGISGIITAQESELITEEIDEAEDKLDTELGELEVEGLTLEMAEERDELGVLNEDELEDVVDVLNGETKPSGFSNCTSQLYRLTPESPTV